MTDILSQTGAAILVAALLSGCSVLPRAHGVAPAKTTPAPVTTAAPQPPPVVPTPKPKRMARETHETREPERLAAIDPKSLIGLQPAAVEKLLGSPSAVAKNEPSLVWTYTGQGCSFQIVFYPDLKTASFHALKYSQSEGEPADSACIRNILTVRSNGPS